MEMELSVVKREISDMQNNMRFQSSVYTAEKRCGKILSIVFFGLLFMWLLSITVIISIFTHKDNIPVGTIMPWLPVDPLPEGETSLHIRISIFQNQQVGSAAIVLISNMESGKVGKHQT